MISAPKDSNPLVATLPTPDNSFVQRLSLCLRTGQSSSSLQQAAAASGPASSSSFSSKAPVPHPLRRPSPAFDYTMPYELRALEVALVRRERGGGETEVALGGGVRP